MVDDSTVAGTARLLALDALGLLAILVSVGVGWPPVWPIGAEGGSAFATSSSKNLTFRRFLLFAHLNMGNMW